MTGPLYQIGDYADCLYRIEDQYCLAEVRLKAGNITSPLWTNIEVNTPINEDTNIFSRRIQNYVINNVYSPRAHLTELWTAAGYSFGANPNILYRSV